MKFGQGLRLVFMAGLTPPLVYYVGILAGGGAWPLPHWMLTATALVAAAVAGVVMFWWPERLSGLLRVLEALLRYCVAFLLITYALNKMIPGQFLLYNRDLDLSLRDLPARRLAWHFLGYSSLYNAFIAGFELIASSFVLASHSPLRASPDCGPDVEHRFDRRSIWDSRDSYPDDDGVGRFCHAFRLLQHVAFSHLGWFRFDLADA